MKKLSILTLLLAFCCGILQAQAYNLTLSGQVTDLTSGLPIPNHPVDIVVDSSNFLGFSYYNTVTTDANGDYSDVIAVPGGVATGTGYTGTRDCTPAGYPTNSFTFTAGASTISNLDFSICSVASCNAAFTYTNVLGSTIVDFADGSTSPNDPIVSWTWSFGDGGVSTLQNPSHTYNSVGSYPVCLDIVTQSGCNSSWCDSMYVGGGSGSSCQASLTGSSAPSGVATFNASGSGTGSIVGYFYDFGDGNTQYSTLSTVSHTYLVAGTYTACVYIDFSDSCVAVSCTQITITGGLQCLAGYYWYPDSSGSYSIIVVNTSQGNGLTYLWTFGDGSTSTQAYPSHQYAGPGTYTVCVIVTSANTTCTDTFCDSLVVVNKVSAPFSINVIANGSVAVDPSEAVGPAVSLYPNPARDFFRVDLHLEDASDVTVSLMDLSGKVVAIERAGELNAGSQSVRVATQGLAAGLYLARVQVGETFSTHKVMIAR